jgi:hypothetical protein
MEHGKTSAPFSMVLSSGPTKSSIGIRANLKRTIRFCSITAVKFSEIGKFEFSVFLNSKGFVMNS